MNTKQYTADPTDHDAVARALLQKYEDQQPVRGRRIYVASSWRNAHQPAIVEALRAAGHEVYDFRNPAPGQKGFAWRDCGGIAASDGPGTGATTIPSYLEAIKSDRAAEGFAVDKAALEWCDTCVLVLPCGRSAHLELGYAAGQGKDTYVLLHEDKFEPELMYLLNNACCTTIDEIITLMARREPGDVMRWHIESGGHFTGPAGHVVRLLREVVELCVAAGANHWDITNAIAMEMEKASDRKEWGGNPKAVPEECADVSILLKIFTNYAGINLNAEERVKLEVLWRREWRADSDGALWRPGFVPQGPSGFVPFGSDVVAGD
jgi:hypothetical protein